MRERLVAACALALAAGACGSGPEATPVVVGYAVAIKSSPPASASIGSPVPLVFAVTEHESDGSSRPASGKGVTVAVTSGGGTINGAPSTTLTTAVDGSVSLTWVLGSAVGTQAVRGSVSAAQYVDVNVITAPLPTLVVTNASCAAGGCRTLEVRAFVGKFNVPGQLPTGFGFVGEVRPGQSCLTFPASWVLRITDAGSGTTTIVTWTPEDTTAIYLVAVDSALYHGGASSQAQFDSVSRGIFPFDGFFRSPAVGETPDFVVSGALGWAVTFPSAPVRGAVLTQGAACTP